MKRVREEKVFVAVLKDKKGHTGVLMPVSKAPRLLKTMLESEQDASGPVPVVELPCDNCKVTSRALLHETPVRAAQLVEQLRLGFDVSFTKFLANHEASPAWMAAEQLVEVAERIPEAFRDYLGKLAQKDKERTRRVVLRMLAQGGIFGESLPTARVEQAAAALLGEHELLSACQIMFDEHYRHRYEMQDWKLVQAVPGFQVGSVPVTLEEVRTSYRDLVESEKRFRVACIQARTMRTIFRDRLWYEITELSGALEKIPTSTNTSLPPHKREGEMSEMQVWIPK